MANINDWRIVKLDKAVDSLRRLRAPTGDWQEVARDYQELFQAYSPSLSAGDTDLTMLNRESTRLRLRVERLRDEYRAQARFVSRR
jgi:hypothetical protein